MSSSDEDFQYTNAAKVFAKFNSSVTSEESNNEDESFCDDFEAVLPKTNHSHVGRNKTIVSDLNPNLVTDSVTRRTRSTRSILNEHDASYSNESIKPRTTRPAAKRKVTKSVKSPRCRNTNINIKSKGNSSIVAIESDIEELLNNCEVQEITGTQNKTPGSMRRGRPRKAKNQVLNNRQITKKTTRKSLGVQDGPIVISDSEEPKNDIVEAVSDINCETCIKVWWQFRELKKFNIRKYQNLTTIFEFYAERENLPTNRLLFTLKETIVKPTDTPESLNIGAGNIIEAGCLSESISYLSNVGPSQKVEIGEDSVQLKVQLRQYKKPLMIVIKKMEPLSVLMAKCSETLNVRIEDLKFLFDGENLNPKDTPNSLDFEGGECIDVFMK